MYLAAMLVLLIAGGLIFFLRGSGDSGTSSGRPGNSPGASGLRTTPGPSSRGKGHKPARPTPTPRRTTPLQRYAVQILPTLDRSTRVFDRAVGAVARTSGLSRLDAACGRYSGQIDLLASQFDGVPHPVPWYSRVGRLHHDALGVYHLMLGAISACHTAADITDGRRAAAAVSDMARAARKMHRIDVRVRRHARRG